MLFRSDGYQCVQCSNFYEVKGGIYKLATHPTTGCFCLFSGAFRAGDGNACIGYGLVYNTTSNTWTFNPTDYYNSDASGYCCQKDLAANIGVSAGFSFSFYPFGDSSMYNCCNIAFISTSLSPVQLCNTV